jgi:hypothetical protein
VKYAEAPAGSARKFAEAPAGSARKFAEAPAGSARKFAKLILALVVTGLAVLAAPGSAHAGPRRDPGAPSADEAALRQAGLVDSEDRRLTQVRAVAAVAPLRGGANFTLPYRLDTGSGYTLVLTQRSEPYQIADLLKLAPQTFVRQPDGSYLLTENIYLNTGAKLRLANPGGLTIRMVSNNNGFVSIVSFGGKLTLEGTAQAKTIITSWDPRTNKEDTDLTDGRAYIRAIGGQFSMKYTEIRQLGFWSGRTGGLSLTGTDRPDTGAVETQKQTREQKRASKAPAGDGPAKSDTAPGAGGVVAGPSGALNNPDTRFGVPGQSYVSVEIAQSLLTGNAFGLFISNAQGITITDTVIERSHEDGLLMHRGASSAVIERTIARNNGGDGFVLSRSTQQVQVSAATSEGNGGNGFTVSGKPLAKGPSASGESTASYGSNSISNSVAKNNGHYGIEILGGIDVSVTNNQIEGSDMGIVARYGGHNVAITSNQLKGQKRQGIAVRDGVQKAKVTGNVITGADTAVYVRASVVEVRGNTIQSARNHGVSLVGAIGGSIVTYNVIGGVGPSAIDVPRATGDFTYKQNQTFAWHDTSSFWVKFRHYASPMTMLWAGIFMVIIFAAVKGASRRFADIKAHPYADKQPLGSATALEITATAARGRARVPGMAQ